MIKMSINSKQFQKEMNNIMEYSYGFLDGVKAGKAVFLKNLGGMVKEVLEEYIDANARMNPNALHHIYEWDRTGNAGSRLFNIQYTVSNLGLSFISTFKQSTSIKNGSNVPFYDKARIMEQGIPVVIRPSRSDVLVFEEDGETVFTKNPVYVDNPGGIQTQGSFEDIFDSFFSKYFTQAFLRSTGVYDYLNNPILYKKNLRSAKKSGRSKGIETGFRWIANAGVNR
jgi:hypothetical protein